MLACKASDKGCSLDLYLNKICLYGIDIIIVLQLVGKYDRVTLIDIAFSERASELAARKAFVRSFVRSPTDTASCLRQRKGGTGRGGREGGGWKRRGSGRGRASVGIAPGFKVMNEVTRTQCQ